MVNLVVTNGDLYISTHHTQGRHHLHVEYDLSKGSFDILGLDIVTRSFELGQSGNTEIWVEEVDIAMEIYAGSLFISRFKERRFDRLLIALASHVPLVMA